MLRIGDYVTVSLGGEVRRCIVATLDEKRGLVDVILLRHYGNTSNPEELDDYEIPSQSMHSVNILSSDDLFPIANHASIDALRSRAAMFFKQRDWRGAVACYEEILHRMSQDSAPHVFLMNIGGEIKVVKQTTSKVQYIDLGSVNSTGTEQFNQCACMRNFENGVNHESLYRIFDPPHLHATILLNFGRCQLNMNQHESALSTFIYAIYISSLSDDLNGRQLRSKCFFWRARARSASGNYSGALRDANIALTLSDETTRVDCEQLVRATQRMLDEDRRGMRVIAREIMKICDEQIRQGNLDINI
jgi:tetratricopeptide (TPR) repeat protein